MPTKAELEAQLHALMSGEYVEPSLTLTDDEVILANVPGLYSGILTETKQAIFIHYLKPILEAQVTKALRGDTTSTKFLVDMVSDLARTTQAKDDKAKWEEKAIQLRDSLGIELSAETMVGIMLDNLLTKTPPNEVNKLLGLEYD